MEGYLVYSTAKGLIILRDTVNEKKKVFDSMNDVNILHLLKHEMGKFDEFGVKILSVLNRQKLVCIDPNLEENPVTLETDLEASIISLQQYEDEFYLGSIDSQLLIYRFIKEEVEEGNNAL